MALAMVAWTGLALVWKGQDLAWVDPATVWAPAMVWALAWNLVMDTVLRVMGLVDMDQNSAALHHQLKQKDQTRISSSDMQNKSNF